MTSHCCAHHSATSSVCQTLDEMAFERGLWSAALNNEIDRVSKLLADGKDVNGLDSAGYTALHYAARSGHAEVCELLLRHGACVNAQTRSGHVTSLHRAAHCNRTAVISVLLSNGADVMLQDDDGHTALHKACQQNNKEAVKQLLTKRVEGFLHVKDKKGNSARHYAIKDDVIQLLSGVD